MISLILAVLNYLIERFAIIPIIMVIIVVFTMSLIATIKKIKINFISHFLITSLLLLFILIGLKVSAGNLVSFWNIIIPIIAFLLVSEKMALMYSSLAFLNFFLIFSVINSEMGVLILFQLTIMFLVITILSYFINKSRLYGFEVMDNQIDELNDAISKKEQSLIQISKMATLGELLSSISHQWKQPIASISALSVNFRIEEELSHEPNEAKLKRIDSLDGHIEFMIETMNDFRSFLKIDKKASDFSLNEVSVKLIKLFINEFETNNIEIDIKEDQDIKVIGYSNMFRQVLLNLIMNAKDAIEETHADNKHIEITFDKNDEYGIIHILDHAGGIESDISYKIFDKQFTTKGEKGNGVGLSMSKELIEDFCYGELKVENTKEGAKFSVFLPLSKS